jgi:glycosyltransferase involved in cell wall biosynthesis
MPGTLPQRRVRILFHLDYLWSGGLEKKAGNLVLGLDRARFEPMVSWASKWGPVGRRLSDAGVPTLRLDPRQPVDGETAAERIRKIAPDVFHSFSCRHQEHDVRAAHAAGVPVIITNRSDGRHWDADRSVQSWELARNQVTHAVIACCESVGALSASVEGIVDKIAVVRNGVALPAATVHGTDILAELALEAPALVLGYAATYRSLKGHAVLIRALREVVDRFPSVHLICCGEEYDDTRTALRRLVAELGIEAHVTLLQAREDVSALYRGLDVYVHPSLSEGLSNSILEAMAHGLPVVATSVGGTPDAVIDRTTGLLVPAGDSHALACAIAALLDDPLVTRRMGDAGRGRVADHFSMAAMVSGYQDVYLRTLAQCEVAVSG